MAPRSCIICGEEAAEEIPLIELPCWNHWVCKDDLADFFVRATENESLYPPSCCDDIILMDDFESHLPEDVQVAFMLKAQGEYQILPKYRVYCANVTCGTFLNPAGHVTDSQANITFAICESDNCGKVTCVTCKALVEDGIEDHICEVQEDERRFKEAVHEQGYKECFVCGRTVELTEACNHITCECGHNFCYVCGKDWSGMHGCPQYGPANYDEEGYNQDGFHRNTELNRAGLTRLEQRLQDRGEDGDDNHDSDNEDQDREEDMPDWDVLQHLSPGNRAIINALPHTHRQDALEMIRIELMEEQGITFNEPQHGDHEANVQDNADDNSDEDNDDNSDDENQEDEVGEGTNQEQGEEGEVDAEDHPESADHEHENNDLYGSDNPVGQAGEVSVELTSSRGVEPFEHDAEHASSGDVAVNDHKGEHMNDETTVLGEHSASPTSHQRETERGNYLIDLSDAGYENDTQVSSFGDNIIALLGVEFGNGWSDNSIHGQKNMSSSSPTHGFN